MKPDVLKTSLFVVSFLLIGGLYFCSSPDKPVSEQDFTRKVVDTNPSVTPLSPQASIKKIQLPPGYSVELVASEPMVQEPVAMAWDGNGRLFVAEMNTYMKD